MEGYGLNAEEKRIAERGIILSGGSRGNAKLIQEVRLQHEEMLKELRESSTPTEPIKVLTIGDDSTGMAITETLRQSLRDVAVVTSVTLDSLDGLGDTAGDLSREIDKMSMEVIPTRNPSLDSDIMEFDENLPSLQKVNNKRKYANHYNNPVKKNWDRHSSRKNRGGRKR